MSVTVENIVAAHGHIACGMRETQDNRELGARGHGNRFRFSRPQMWKGFVKRPGKGILGPNDRAQAAHATARQ